MKKKIYTIIVIIILAPVFLMISYISHTISNNTPKQKLITEKQKQDCLKNHPYKLHEGISLCDTVADFKEKFPDYNKHYSYEYHKHMFQNDYTQKLEQPADHEDMAGWSNWLSNRSRVRSQDKLKERLGLFDYYLYKMFPQTIPVSSASYSSVYNKHLNKYFTPNDPDNFKLETTLYSKRKSTSKERSTPKNYSLVKMNLNKNLEWPPSQIGYRATLYDGNFDYEKYYNDLVELNGEPLSKKHVINSPMGGTYLTACWGNCSTDEGIDYDEYYCKDNSPNTSCMLISYFTVEREDDGTNSSTMNVYIR